MTLPLFDDASFGDPESRAPRPVTLVRLAGEIARSLGSVGRIAVDGEVHRPTVTRSGAIFFTLRDRAAQIEVKVPAANARRCRAVAGERVCVVGSLQWTPDRGQVHVAADEVTPVGAGAIAAMVAETRRRLTADGLLDRPRRPIPMLPAVVGVICGSDAAVRKDIESVAAARCPGYPIHFQETTVSGPGAALSIVEAIEAAARVPGVQVMILARGGGDAPSLLPWSSEEVCRAVAACAVPVVSAIGHDADRPLCDEVADLRSGTPSLAATAVLPDLVSLGEAADALLARAGGLFLLRVDVASRRLAAVDTTRALVDGVGRAETRLERMGERLARHHPARRIAECESRLAATSWRRLTWDALGKASGRLAADRRHLEALSPQRTLERGYAVVSRSDGEVLRSASELEPGDVIAVRLASGRLRAGVIEVHESKGDGS